jgi:integrase
LKWSDFDWQNLSVYIRRAIVSGRVDDVKTDYSEAPLPLDPALAEVIFEWRRKTEFSADSDFVFASRYMAGEKPYTPWNMQHNQLSPAVVRVRLGPIGWHTLRHT